MDKLQKLAEKIIEEQEKVIGPIAIEQARQVPGLVVNWDKHEVNIEGDERIKIEELVNKYRDLFGRIAVDVCKEALKEIDVPKEQLPAILQ